LLIKIIKYQNHSNVIKNILILKSQLKNNIIKILIKIKLLTYISRRKLIIKNIQILLNNTIIFKKNRIRTYIIKNILNDCNEKRYL